MLSIVGCFAGSGTWTAAALSKVIAEKSLCAVAEAAALAISTPDGCLAAGIVYGGAQATCPAPASAPAPAPAPAPK
jgi:hypothetical protein